MILHERRCTVVHHSRESSKFVPSWSVSSFAQLDTIHIGQIRSSVPIVGKLADLPFVFDGKGEWRYGTFNFELKYYSWTIDDTAIYVNRVNTIYDKKTKTYYDSGL